MRIILFAAVGLFSAQAVAQDGSLAFTEMPALEMPPREFATAEEHYNFLYERADGGTQHTMETIPVWDGLWGSGSNTMPNIFFVDGHLGIVTVGEAEFDLEHQTQLAAS